MLCLLFLSSISSANAIAKEAGSNTSCLSAAYRQAAYNYLKEEKFTLAIENYEKAAQCDPALSTATYFNLAIAYYATRNMSGAIASLEKLIAIDPADVEAQYNLACLRLYKGDTKKAKLHFEQARNCCDRDPKFRPFIDKGLKFLDQLKKADPPTQDLVSFFLAQGLPSIVIGG